MKLEELVTFYLEEPLYSEHKFSSYNQLWDFFIFYGNFDGFCTECNDQTIFHAGNRISGVYYKEEDLPKGERKITFEVYCSRKNYHKIKFYMYQKGLRVQKIGQFPSLADISIAEHAKFRKELERIDKDLSSEFYKALGLAAHGVGVGAFVYLRRVIEKLVEKRFDNLKSSGEIELSDEEFYQKRVAEKIKALKKFLPDILTKNTKVYSVLSKGVHELDEQECKTYFPALKEIIILILEEDIEKREKQTRIEKAQEALDKINPEKPNKEKQG